MDVIYKLILAYLLVKYDNLFMILFLFILCFFELSLYSLAPRTIFKSVPYWSLGCKLQHLDVSSLRRKFQLTDREEEDCKRFLKDLPSIPVDLFQEKFHEELLEEDLYTTISPELSISSGYLDLFEVTPRSIRQYLDIFSTQFLINVHLVKETTGRDPIFFADKINFKEKIQLRCLFGGFCLANEDCVQPLHSVDTFLEHHNRHLRSYQCFACKSIVSSRKDLKEHFLSFSKCWEKVQHISKESVVRLSQRPTKPVWFKVQAMEGSRDSVILPRSRVESCSRTGVSLPKIHSSEGILRGSLSYAEFDWIDLVRLQNYSWLSEKIGFYLKFGDCYQKVCPSCCRKLDGVADFCLKGCSPIPGIQKYLSSSVRGKTTLCPWCTKKNGKPLDGVYHSLRDHHGVFFVCRICNQVCSSFTRWKIHLEEHLRIFCVPGERKGDLEYLGRWHLVYNKLARSGKFYPCQICCIVFCSSQHLEDHLKTHQKDFMKQGKVPVQYWVCPYEGCKGYFVNQKSLLVHVTLDHQPFNVLARSYLSQETLIVQPAYLRQLQEDFILLRDLILEKGCLEEQKIYLTEREPLEKDMVISLPNLILPDRNPSSKVLSECGSKPRLSLNVHSVLQPIYKFGALQFQIVRKKEVPYGPQEGSSSKVGCTKDTPKECDDVRTNHQELGPPTDSEDLEMDWKEMGSQGGPQEGSSSKVGCTKNAPEKYDDVRTNHQESGPQTDSKDLEMDRMEMESQENQGFMTEEEDNRFFLEYEKNNRTLRMSIEVPVIRRKRKKGLEELFPLSKKMCPKSFWLKKYKDMLKFIAA